MFTIDQNEMFQEITQNLGIDFQIKDKLQVIQTPGFLKSTIQAVDLSTAIMAAFGLAIDQLGQIRGLPSQTISIDRRHSNFMLNSVMYHYINGWAISMKETHIPVNSFYKTKDNHWMFYNGTYPHLRDGILKYLDCANHARPSQQPPQSIPQMKLKKI